MSNTRSVEDIYRSFTTSGAKAAKQMMESSRLPPEGSVVSAFDLLQNLLFPSPAGALKSAREFWNEMSRLASEKQYQLVSGNNDASAKELAKIIRFYHANLGEGDDALSTQVKDFYQNHRPSAYKAYTQTKTPDGKSFHDSNLNNMFTPLLPKEKLSGTVRDYNTSLTYVLVDSPIVDLKMRRADKADVFLNYMPTLITSQLIPYLEVEFCQTRVAPTSVAESSRVEVMGQLRFLLGAEEIGKDTVDKQFYDASIKKSTLTQGPPRNNLALRSMTRDAKSGFTVGGKASTKSLVDATSPSAGAAPDVSQKFLTSTGMDLFMMPQTLVNMDYDQTSNPRFNQVLNPVLPFGSIISATIDVKSSVGVMSYKTATLVLKIFDRSRLVEIADFINPKLYKSSTVWLTYGWRAPTSYRSEDPINPVRTYYDFVNENMLIREAYGVMNTSMTIENDGTVSVTLSLYTKGGINILETSDTLSKSYNDLEETLNQDLMRLSELARKLGLQAFVDVGKDLRGTTLMAAAIGGDLISLDYTSLVQERKAINENLDPIIKQGGQQAADAQAFVSLINKLYISEGEASAVKGDGKAELAITQEQRQLAIGLARDRFSEMSRLDDLFGYTKEVAPGEPNTGKNLLSGEFNPLRRILDNLSDKGRAVTEDPASAGTSTPPYGTVSFGRLFAYYFSQIARSLSEGSIVDEFQVVFYRLNDFAGKAGGINLAEFPIDMYTLEKSYAKRVQEQKGERMSFNLFLEVVRESQFGDVRSKAYGFRDLYNFDPKTKELVIKSGNEKELASRTLRNDNRGAPFTLPAVEFYVEVGYKDASGSVVVDLLDAFDIFTFGPDKSSLPHDQYRIMRIHVYDRAASPHTTAARILRSPEGYIEVNDEYIESIAGMQRQEDGAFTNESLLRLNRLRQIFANAQAAVAQQKTSSDQMEALDKSITGELLKSENKDLLKFAGGSFDAKKSFRFMSFRDGKYASFEKVKEQISRLVPTISIGSQGSSVTNVSYSTNQEALLSTIMMLRSPGSSQTTSTPNGSADGDLPLRVIPGQLSLNTLGCPIVEYMQQFFIDLGTGTTVDNLYNVTGLTHTITKGKFESQFKFTFADAYGQYEGAQNIVDSLTSKLSYLSAQIAAGTSKKPGTK